MPLNIPAGDGIASIRMRYGSDPEDMICTLGCRSTELPLGQAHAQRLLSSWTTWIMPLLDDSLGLLGVTLRVRDDGGGDFVYDANVTASTPGGTAGSGLPSNCAALVHKQSTRAGRRGRGRMYVPGLVESAIDEEGLLTVGGVAAWNSALESLFDSLVSAGGPGPPAQAQFLPILLHNNATTTTRTSSGGTTTVTTVEGAAGPVPDLITALTIDSKIATQRRRLRP